MEGVLCFMMLLPVQNKIKTYYFFLAKLWIKLSNNAFTNNSAILQGGGLNFANIVPNVSFINENIFLNNNATYGGDYASYPIRMVLYNTGDKINQFHTKSIPGIQIPISLTFYLVDHFQNLVNLDFNM